MSTPQLERLQAHCQRLRLYQVAAELPSLLEQAAKAERSYTDFLEEVLRREVQAKTDKHLAMRLAMARFPFQKTLETFDFKVQPSIDVKLIRELGTGRYLEQGENALFLGPPGVGKTHLAVALGIAAICSSSSSLGAMRRARSCSPAIRASAPGATCLAIR